MKTTIATLLLVTSTSAMAVLDDRVMPVICGNVMIVEGVMHMNGETMIWRGREEDGTIVEVWQTQKKNRYTIVKKYQDMNDYTCVISEGTPTHEKSTSRPPLVP